MFSVIQGSGAFLRSIQYSSFGNEICLSKCLRTYFHFSYRDIGALWFREGRKTGKNLTMDG